MALLTSDTLVNQMRWRYAVKRFDPARKLSSQDWDALETALVLSPSSYGLQPWKFLVVQSPEVRKKLTPASWNQTQVEECSHYVVFLNKKGMDEKHLDEYLSTIVNTRKVTLESLGGYRKMILSSMPLMSADWAGHQVYIALGTLMTAAAMMGIDACPLEGIDRAKYDEILGLDGSGFSTLVCCAVGYRSKEDKYANAAKVRFDRKDIVQYI